MISQSNGTSKYICKYVTKKDEGNKAILFSNSCTEDICVGLQFLQYTKIATSAINESKAFQSKRYKNHPTGTEFPDIYSLHLILGYQKSQQIYPSFQAILVHLSFVLSTLLGLTNVAILLIIMKQMMLFVSYLFLLWLHLFGSVVPQPWLDLEGYLFWFLLSQRLLWQHLAGSVFGSSSVSIYCGCIWREVVFVPFQSSFIVVASGGRLVVGSF